MIPKTALRVAAVTSAVALLPLGATQAAAAEGQNIPEAAGVVLTYDASGAEEFTDVVHEGAQVWNQSVESVELRAAEAGESPNITIVADDGWPRAQTTSLGNGRIWMGRQAVQEGHNTLRISSHELGHLLGLPDIKPGPCSSLMSGSSAGTDCANAYPDEAEKAEVEGNFAGALAPEVVRELKSPKHWSAYRPAA